MLILTSVNLPNDGPVCIAFGRVKTRVKTANTAIVPSRIAIRGGDVCGTGLPKMLRCMGIVSNEGNQQPNRRLANECRGPH